MDTKVTHLGSTVVAALRAASYAESTIGQYEKTICVLDQFVDSRGGVYTSFLGADFASLTVSPRTGKFSAQRRSSFRRIVTLFDALLDTGEVVLAVRKRGGGGPHPRSDVFIALKTAWETDMRQRELAPATREAYGRVARKYLTYLEGEEIYCLEAARPQRARFSAHCCACAGSYMYRRSRIRTGRPCTFPVRHTFPLARTRLR